MYELTVKDISKSFGKKVALNNVSLKVKGKYVDLAKIFTRTKN